MCSIAILLKARVPWLSHSRSSAGRSFTFHVVSGSPRLLGYCLGIAMSRARQLGAEAASHVAKHHDADVRTKSHERFEILTSIAWVT